MTVIIFHYTVYSVMINSHEALCLHTSHTSRMAITIKMPKIELCGSSSRQKKTRIIYVKQMRQHTKSSVNINVCLTKKPHVGVCDRYLRLITHTSGGLHENAAGTNLTCLQSHQLQCYVPRNILSGVGCHLNILEFLICHKVQSVGVLLFNSLPTSVACQYF